MIVFTDFKQFQSQILSKRSATFFHEADIAGLEIESLLYKSEKLMKNREGFIREQNIAIQICNRNIEYVKRFTSSDKWGVFKAKHEQTLQDKANEIKRLDDENEKKVQEVFDLQKKFKKIRDEGNKYGSCFDILNNLVLIVNHCQFIEADELDGNLLIEVRKMLKSFVDKNNLPFTPEKIEELKNEGSVNSEELNQLFRDNGFVSDDDDDGSFIEIQSPIQYPVVCEIDGSDVEDVSSFPHIDSLVVEKNEHTSIRQFVKNSYPNFKRFPGSIELLNQVGDTFHKQFALLCPKRIDMFISLGTPKCVITPNIFEELLVLMKSWNGFNSIDYVTFPHEENSLKNMESCTQLDSICRQSLVHKRYNAFNQILVPIFKENSSQWLLAFVDYSKIVLYVPYNSNDDVHREILKNLSQIFNRTIFPKNYELIINRYSSNISVEDSSAAILATIIFRASSHSIRTEFDEEELALIRLQALNSLLLNKMTFYRRIFRD